jgi:hypothetical protein
MSGVRSPKNGLWKRLPVQQEAHQADHGSDDQRQDQDDFIFVLVKPFRIGPVLEAAFPSGV